MILSGTVSTAGQQFALGSGIDRAAHRVQKAEQRAYCAPRPLSVTLRI